VKLLFERAAFTAEDTIMTAEALFWFGPGMGAMAATQVLTRAYYALGDTRTPLIFGISSIAVNIGCSILLTPVAQHGGLALANSLASLFYAAGMYILLLRRLPKAGYQDMLKTLIKVLAGSGTTACTALYAYRLAGSALMSMGTIGLFIAVGGAVCAGILSFIVVIFLLKENELFLFVRQWKKQSVAKAEEPL
ncbi:MAG: polysaccharide biosynthesis C-terminal domain-containing protein, partial [Clostridiales bacterium]|nr:polysaccharide biosynthesis C-terminal domain-containing protein [Clostridiales bacterium]